MINEFKNRSLGLFVDLGGISIPVQSILNVKKAKNIFDPKKPYKTIVTYKGSDGEEECLLFPVSAYNEIVKKINEAIKRQNEHALELSLSVCRDAADYEDLVEDIKRQLMQGLF